MIADAHVANHRRWGGPSTGGLNLRGRECVATLRRAAQRAEQEECTVLVVLGDLFDSTRPSPSLVYETVAAITQSTAVNVVIVLGNHDRQSQHDIDHACASAALSPRVEVVTRPKVVHAAGLDLLCIPYEPGEAKDWLTAGLAELAHASPKGSRGKRRVVATHLGVWDDETQPFMRGARDSVGLGHARWLLDAHGLDGLYAGNWHEARRWEREPGVEGEVVIPGTVCPHSFSDPPGYGHMTIYDGVSNASTPVVVMGPRFLTLRSVAEIEEQISSGVPYAYESRSYVRVVVPADQLDAALSARNRLEALGNRYELQVRGGPGRIQLPDSWRHFVVHVEVDDSGTRESVRESAREATTAGDDLSGFAELARVEAPGTAGGVARRLAEYRKVAG